MPQTDRPQGESRSRDYDALDIATFVLETFGLVAVIAYTAVNAWQASLTAQSVQTSQRQFELSERPWVSIDPVQFSDLTFDKAGAHFALRFAIKNTGHSPATHAQIDAQLFPIRLDQIFTEPIRRQKLVCGAVRGQTKGIAEFAAFTLFPQQQTTRDEGFSMNPDEMRAAEHPGPQAMPADLVMPIIVGCIDYQFAFEQGHHQTPFMFMLYRTDPKTPFAGLAVYIGKNVPANSLRLDSYPFASIPPD